MTDRELSEDVLALAFKVHSAFGPGLLESAYETCLAFELSRAGFVIERQKLIPIIYEGIEIDGAFRLDILVEERLLLELKTVDEIAPIHTAQVLTYLKLLKLRFGLILNFNVKSLKYGIKRVVNGY